MHPLLSALRKRTLEMDPYTPLFIFMFGATILLFATCFVSDSIYFIEGKLGTTEVYITFGLFSICLVEDPEIGKMCTDTKVGYQLDALEFFGEITKGYTTTSYLPALGGLTLHLVSFISSILALGIMIFSIHRRNLLSRWIFEIASFVGGLVLAAYFIDISLYFSLSKKVAPQPLFVGNGTWLTLVAFLMIASGGIFFKIHAIHNIKSETRPPLPPKDRIEDLEKGLNTKIDHTVSTSDYQPPNSEHDVKEDFKTEEQYYTTTLTLDSQPTYPSEHSRTPSGGSRVTTSASEPLAQPPASESAPQPPQEAMNEDDVQTPSPSLPSLAWNGTRESTSSRGGIPSSRLLPDSEPDELLSTRASSPFFRDRQSAYAPSSYHTYQRESSSSVQTGSVAVPDDQAQTFPSRASSCLNSPVTKPKGARSENRVSNRDLSRSGSLASNATSKRSLNRMTPQPFPLPKIPDMPPVQPIRKLPPRPRIDTSLLQVYPPLITAFVNDSFTSLMTVNSGIPSESALSTPQVSPVQPITG